MAQALLPLKDLVQAKTRLAGLLSASERRHLAQCMVEDVLAVLVSHGEFSRVTLVSDDPSARLLAASYKVDFLQEASLGCRGLNPVLQAAAEQIRQSSARELVVLHGDLPLLSTSDLSAALELQRDCGGLVVGCDRHGTGTNLLTFSSDSPPVFQFGEGSCARHLDWASSVHLQHNVLRRQGIGLDVDAVADLQLLLQEAPHDGATKTLHMLHESGLARRLDLALPETSTAPHVDVVLGNEG